MIQTIKHRITGATLYESEHATLRAAVEAAVKAGASLRGANLRGANLAGAYLGAPTSGAPTSRAPTSRGADLADATMPDGRPWEAYCADPLAGICDEPEARSRAIAAWGHHSWTDCPMAAGLGVRSLGEVAADKRVAVAAFVALFDARLLGRDAPARRFEGK